MTFFTSIFSCLILSKSTADNGPAGDSLSSSATVSFVSVDLALSLTVSDGSSFLIEVSPSNKMAIRVFVNILHFT